MCQPWQLYPSRYPSSVCGYHPALNGSSLIFFYMIRVTSSIVRHSDYNNKQAYPESQKQRNKLRSYRIDQTFKIGSYQHNLTLFESNFLYFQIRMQKMILVIQKVSFDFWECLDCFTICQLCRFVSRLLVCHLGKLSFSCSMHFDLLICSGYQSIKEILSNMSNQAATKHQKVFLVRHNLVLPFQFFTHDRRTLVKRVPESFNWIKFYLVNQQLQLKRKKTKRSFSTFLGTMCQALVWRVQLNL